MPTTDDRDKKNQPLITTKQHLLERPEQYSSFQDKLFARCITMQHHHDHPAGNVALPLRLAAEPYAKEGISSSCVSLGILVATSTASTTSVELAALADDDGIHAFCMSERLPRAALLERLQSAVPHTDIATTGWQTQPLLVLLRDKRSNSNPNLMQWHVFEENEEEVQPISANVVKDRMLQQKQQNHFPVHNAFVAELITNAIRQYYSQQILEPSVRGFLSVLEKQFARSDLYLFELLQNAVDDGATVVEFSLKQPQINKNKTPTTASLQMTHNGRSFTPLDVLGLSSVGLSTKSRQGKRTIGFMGVGFKAVYKRYARVSIDDGTYRFVYQEPPNNKLGYGWVMLPLWQQQQQQGVSEDKKGWCRFSLEQPRGGPADIRRDLLVLPRTAPPLLGRAALVKMTNPTTSAATTPQQWILDWNGKHHTIERSYITSYASYTSNKQNNNNGSELITVTINTENSKTGASSIKANRWLFLTHKYKPSREAAETYRNHTKRSYEGMEEVCGFIPLIGDNQDIPHTLPSSSSSSTTPSGWVHSVLPTKIRMPVPIHFQGSWLLSVDRQQVQDLTDNVWNGEILQQFPHIIATIFRWAAAQQLSSSSHYEAICQLLPNITTTTNTDIAASRRHNRSGHTMANILGQDVSFKTLEQAFWSEPILPIGRNAKIQQESTTSNGDNNAMDIDTPMASSLTVPPISTSYYEGSNSIWVPPSWFEFLDADFLRGWLGKRPLRSDMLGKAAFHPLFASEHVLNQLNPLPTRINQLAAELGVRTGSQLQSDAVWKTIRLMAAIGSSYDEHPNSASMTPGDENNTRKKQTTPKDNNNNNKNNSQNQGGTNTDVSAPSLPSSITNWPVFVTETCNLARLDQVILPSSDFAELPYDLQALLRPYFIKDTSDVSLQQQQRFGGGKKDKRNKRQPQPPRLKRLHNQFEAAISMVDRHTADPNIIPESFETDQATWRRVSASASSFLKRAREELPENAMEVTTAASNLLQSYSTQRNLSEEEVLAVLQIGQFAFDTSNQLLLNYVLVDFPSSTLSSTGVPSSSTRLAQATAAYIGRSMDENGPGADLESFAGSKLHYISSRYNSILESMSVIARRKAINLCALAGVQTGMSISVSVASNFDKDKRLLETILPKLDGKRLPPSRKNATKSDVILPYGLGVVMNKKRYYLLDSQIPVEWERLVTTMPPSSAIGFISLLLSVPFESSTNITPSNVVAAANCLAGRTEPSEEKHAPVESAKLLKDTACPLRRRLYFLPPGQAGAKALDVSESRLVEQLKAIRWLPCSVNHSPLTLLRPREALLEADPSRPEMPAVELPSSLLKRLKASQVALSLTWGVQAPPAPVGELVELAKEANRLLAVESERVDREAIATAASRLFDLWNTVCRSHMRGGLSQSDKKALRTASTLPCIPVKRVLDSGGSGNWIVLPKRCVRMAEALPESKSENDLLRHLTVASLVASDFICDFSHSIHNPFFHQPEVSNAVVQLAGIRTLADFQTNALVSVCGSFVRHCCAAKPAIPSRASPLRESFSFCLNWCLSSPSELPKKGQGLEFYVRHGPGIGAKALPARWVSLKGGPVQVVLNDSRARSALLSPEMNIQLLGVLDHTENDKDCANAKLLSDIDAKVIKALGILRLSDKRFLVKTRARGTASIVGSDAASKLQLVCALLKALELDRLSATNTANQASENNFLGRSYEPPLIVRHESLTREFQAPGMDTPSLIPLYAMFGRAPKLTKKRCILVSGDPADYSMELEELILDHVGVRANLSMAQMKPYRAATRLLLHLESDTLFKKFLERDFADFEATSVWKKLAERREMLEQLEKATKKEDKQMLRELLIKGEELFDEDPDRGDSALQNPRDLLARLEEEAAAVAEEAKLTKERQEREDAKSKMHQEINPSTNTLATNPSILEARGRGRGVDNRPAWMTKSEYDDFLSKTPIAEEEAKAKMDQAPLREDLLETNPSTNTASAGNASAPEARGRGRGVDNRPAWMTGSGSGPSGPSGMIETPEPQQSSLSTLPVSMAGDEALTTAEEAKSILSSILNTSTEGDVHTQNGFACGLPPPVENAPALIAGAGRGRGRGLSNLPAWMTNPSSQDRLTKGSESHGEVDSGLKRSQPSSPHNGEDGGLTGSEAVTKKARIGSASVRLTLDVELVPSEQPAFISWFQSKVDEEVGRRGGKLSLSVSKLECGKDV